MQKRTTKRSVHPYQGVVSHCREVLSPWESGKDTFRGRSSISHLDGEKEKGSKGKKGEKMTEKEKGKEKGRRKGGMRRRGRGKKDLTIIYKSGLIFCSGVFLQ